MSIFSIACKTAMIVIYQLLVLVLDIIGLVVVPIAIAFGHWQASNTTGLPIFTAPRWLWLWGNDEDGYRPQWYIDKNPRWPLWFLMWQWAAIRNSTDNLRFVRFLNPPQRADDVQWRTFGNWTFVWQGVLGRWIWHYDHAKNGGGAWFWCGWKYSPEAKDAEGWGAIGCGFATRYGRN